MYVRETPFKIKSNIKINQEEVSHKLLMFRAESSDLKLSNTQCCQLQ